MYKIGMVYVGQLPEDDLLPYLHRSFTKPVEVLERGLLDSLDAAGILALGPEPGTPGIVSRLRDGSLTLLSHSKIIPGVQREVDQLVADGAEFVVILCGADWSDIWSSRLVVNPGKLFPGVVSALAGRRRLGVIKPSEGQIQKETRRYADLGVEAIVTAAEPSGDASRLRAAREAGLYLKEARVDLVWMSCVAMDAPMRAEVEQVVGKPVILARSLLAGILDELVPAQ